ncbi:MAG: sulfotransferase [Colwellia sp.]|nr:sulfotransferase [Colwellia sp.]
MKKPNLLLLFGMPRSGTTWIGKLFDSHKDTYYLHEPDSVEPDFSIPLLASVNSADENKLKKKVEEWLQPTKEKVIASRPFFSKSYMNPLQWSLFLFTAYACKVTSKFKFPFLNKPIRLQSKAPLTVWKSIESLGRIPALKTSIDAFSIQILRHPCGQIASTLRGEKMHQFDGSVSTCEDWDLFDKLLEQSAESRFSLDDIKMMSPEERLALRWGIINDFALKGLNSDNSCVLLYEDLCRDPKEKLSQLFQLVGLTFSKETQAFLAESTCGEDKAYYATKKTPLVAAYKWRDELTTEQQSRIALIINQFESGQYYLDDF